ncbi:MAG: iron-sulfur cluster assembly scaffold protein [Planctomycetes bacterium]|nr:iron-sulfur cluster assembly scaffold protein [Planctomycetota bacterium]
MQAGVGAGECAGTGVARGRASHPVCGDEVHLSLRTDGDRVVELRWRAQGCPATVAVAALAAKVLPGAERAAAEQLLARAVETHGGLVPAERHALSLVQRALAAALAETP